jgi:hypothetical protein
MMPIVQELEKNLDLKIDKREVWQDEANHKLMQKYSDILEKACEGMLGVPTFYNTQSKQALCGEQTLENLKIWALGGSCQDNICKPHSKNKKLA